ANWLRDRSTPLSDIVPEVAHILWAPHMRRLAMFATVFLGWSVLAGHSQSSASLLVNGSFEQGPAVRTYLNLAAGNTSLPGWTVTGEGVDLVSTGYWISADGTRAIDLDGSAGSGQTPPYVHG